MSDWKLSSDIGNVLISISESIPISDIKEKMIPLGGLDLAPLEIECVCNSTLLWCLTLMNGMSDIAYRFKIYFDIRHNVGLSSLSPILEVPISVSVRYRWSRISDKVPTYAGLFKALQNHVNKLWKLTSHFKGTFLLFLADNIYTIQRINVSQLKSLLPQLFVLLCEVSDHTGQLSNLDIYADLKPKIRKKPEYKS